MKELHDLQTSQLINLIARETITYYKLIGDCASVEECTQCNSRIRQIEMELNSRRMQEEKNMFELQNVYLLTEMRVIVEFVFSTEAT